MAERIKLPVIKIFEEALAFSFKRYPTIFRICLSATILALVPAITILFLAAPDIFTANTFDATSTDFDAEFGKFFGIVFPVMFIAIFLFYGMIAAPLSRLIVLDERAPLISINRSVWMFFLSWVVLMGLFLGFALGLALILVPTGMLLRAFAPGYEGLIAIGAVLFFFTFYYSALRLSLLQTDSIVNGSINVRRSWQLLRKNMLRMIGLWILMMIVIFLIMAAMQLIILPLSLLGANTMWAEISEVSQDASTSPMALMLAQLRSSPFVIASMLVSMVAQFWVIGFMYSMPAFMYKALTASAPQVPEV